MYCSHLFIRVSRLHGRSGNGPLRYDFGRLGHITQPGRKVGPAGLNGQFVAHARQGLNAFGSRQWGRRVNLRASRLCRRIHSRDHIRRRWCSARCRSPLFRPKPNRAPLNSRTGNQTTGKSGGTCFRRRPFRPSSARYSLLSTDIARSGAQQRHTL